MFGQALDSHLPPTAAGSPLLQDDFLGFVAWRETRIAAEIAKVTGVVINRLDSGIREDQNKRASDASSA